MCWPTRTTSRNVGKRLPAPSTTDWDRRPPTRDGPAARAWSRRFTAPSAAAAFPPRLSPLRSSRSSQERYAQSAWPESHPVSIQKLLDTVRSGQVLRLSAPPRSVAAALGHVLDLAGPPSGATGPDDRPTDRTVGGHGAGRVCDGRDRHTPAGWKGCFPVRFKPRMGPPGATAPGRLGTPSPGPGTGCGPGVRRRTAKPGGGEPAVSG